MICSFHEGTDCSATILKLLTSYYRIIYVRTLSVDAGDDEYTMAEIDNPHVAFDNRSEEFVGTFAPDTLASEALIEMLAAIQECDPLDVGPIGDSVDTDALNKLVNAAGDTVLQISFDIDGYTVRIGADRSIVLTTN